MLHWTKPLHGVSFKKQIFLFLFYYILQFNCINKNAITKQTKRLNTVLSLLNATSVGYIVDFCFNQGQFGICIAGK